MEKMEYQFDNDCATDYSHYLQYYSFSNTRVLAPRTHLEKQGMAKRW